MGTNLENSTGVKRCDAGQRVESFGADLVLHQFQLEPGATLDNASVESVFAELVNHHVTLQPPTLATMAKKRKISVSGVELIQAHAALKRLKSSLVIEEEEDTDSQVKVAAAKRIDDFAQGLDDMIMRLESRLAGPQSLTFSGVNEETLTKMNIVQKCGLRLKCGNEERVETSKQLGKAEFWSSTHMYHHLAVLENLVANENEATSRVWIDTFLFRASAMMPQGQRMVLNMEHDIPPTSINPSTMSTIAGISDYTAVVTGESDADVYRNNPRIASARSIGRGFFVTEAKSGPISQHIPQAVCQLYACGKQLGKNTIRGASRDGRFREASTISMMTIGLRKLGGSSITLCTCIVSFTMTMNDMPVFYILNPPIEWCARCDV
ncbi:hypothetical protein LshimejAT787_1402830 [Lyophyllum shimeji]|uniref:Uncharacterized protein n=1 Tax=Lyophyllum shimeji TaxID=47721 RepID=A0A9P3PZ52_LYOSH|nr:hypothetical protein LshimejAT787_1402830 [Lyophyllum shimeji]